MSFSQLVHTLKPILSNKAFKYTAMITTAAVGLSFFAKSYIEKDVTLNVNNEKFILHKGMDIKSIESKEKQAIASIFDINNDKKLQLSELFDSRNFNKGLFSTIENTDGIQVNFNNDDCNIKWIFDKDINCTVSERDLDNDGNIDIRRFYKYDKNNKEIENTEEKLEYVNNKLARKESLTFFDNGNRDKSIIEEYKEGQLIRKRYETQIYDEKQCFSKTINYEEKDENGKPIVSFGLSNFTNFALMEEALKEAFGEKILDEEDFAEETKEGSEK